MPDTTTNHPAHDATLALAKTVGTNFRTLRDNKRKLAYNLVIGVAVEGFGWTDEWAAVKKAMKFATLEKPEQNQINVFGTMCKTIVLAWSSLADDVKASFVKGDLLASTLAATIKDAEKAADKAEAEVAATEQASEQASTTPDPREAAPPADFKCRAETIAMVADMFDTDVNAADFTPGEIKAMMYLIEKVDAFKANLVEQAKAA